MKLPDTDRPANCGHEAGNDGFHTVPNQASPGLQSRSQRNTSPPEWDGRRIASPLTSLPQAAFRFCSIIMVLLAPLLAGARTIYVSTKGSDSNSGSSANPYRSMAKAHAQAANGDVIRLEGGHYEEYLTMTKRVTIENWNGRASVGSVGPVNQPPNISGITNSIFFYPEGHWRGSDIELPGVVTDDGLPNPPGKVLLAWSVVEGSVLLDNPTSWPHQAHFQRDGLHILRLTASDGLTNSSVDWVVRFIPTNSTSFEVHAEADSSVSTNAEAWLVGEVLVDKVKLYPPKAYGKWTKSSGPGSVSFPEGLHNDMIPRAFFSKAGTYYLRFTGWETADTGRSGSALVTVVVTNGSPIITPPPCRVAASAGSDFELIWARGRTTAICTNLNGAVELNGRLNPSSGVSVEWSGPSGVTFDSKNILRPSVCFPGPGTYQFTLRATGCNPATNAYDSLTVTVTREPDCPSVVVNAGVDRTLFLGDPPSSGILTAPDVCTTLSGTVNPSSGVTVRWSRVSGPGTVTFGTPNSTTTEACFTQIGTYVLRLTTVSGGCTNWDDTVTTVKYAARHYLVQEDTRSACVCGTTIRYRNTHPSCAIESTFRVMTCGFGPSGSRTFTRTVTLQPGQSTDPYLACSLDLIEIMSADFLCSSAATALSGARLQMPAASDLPWIRTAQAQAAGTESVHAASAAVELSVTTLEFLLFGDPGQEYSVEASDDLTNWSPIAVVTASENPVWIQDPDGGGHQRRFYRAIPR